MQVFIPGMGVVAVLAAAASTLSADCSWTSLAFFVGFSLSYTSNQRSNILNESQLFYIKHSCNYFHVRSAWKALAQLLSFNDYFYSLFPKKFFSC